MGEIEVRTRRAPADVLNFTARSSQASVTAMGQNRGGRSTGFAIYVREGCGPTNPEACVRVFASEAFFGFSGPDLRWRRWVAGEPAVRQTSRPGLDSAGPSAYFPAVSTRGVRLLTAVVLRGMHYRNHVSTESPE